MVNYTELCSKNPNPISKSLRISSVINLGALFIIATILIFGSIALLSGSLSKVFNKSEKSQKFLNKLASFVFLGLAIKLITTKQ